MKWYYVDQGKQAGPVEEAQFEELRRTGVIQPDTLVWREGLPDWKPCVEVTGSLSGVPGKPAASGGGLVCAECGRAFGLNDVTRHQDRWVCNTCRPVYLQRLARGAAAGMPGTGQVTQEELLLRDYKVEIGDYCGRAWEMFKGSPGIIIGASVLVYITLFAANIIPYLNWLLALIFTGPLMGGLWLFYIRQIRGQGPGVGDAFGGFGPRFGQLLLVQLIPTLVAMGFVFLLGVGAALTIPALLLAGRHSGETPALAAPMLVFLGVVLLVFVVVMIYLNTCWAFALPLAVDKGLRFWPALELSRRVVSKHWWMTFLLILVCGLLATAGLFACVVGMLITGPIAFAMLAFHYNKVFGDLVSEPG